MNETKKIAALPGMVTRRNVIGGMVVALGSLAAGGSALADSQSSTNEMAGAAASAGKTSLHYEAEFKVGPKRIYDALLDSKQFAEFSGVPAEIDPKAGGVFSMFGGRIVGRNVELISEKRIVQAWRPAHWDAGIYSIVKFEFHEHESKTTMILDHTGFPAEEYDHLNAGWKLHYLDPLAKYFA